MGRILCAWSPRWPIANWRRRNPCEKPASPFALIHKVRAVRLLAAVDVGAARLGLYTGQKATDAMALIPHLITAEAEPEADSQALDELSDWCVRFSPAVAIDPPDGLFLDISGTDHLWGGEAQMMADFRSRLAANGLPFRTAIADTPGAAWALAHFQDRAIAPPGGQGDLLAPLPVAALRLELNAATQMRRLGFKTVGQLMAIPRAPLARRFGAHTLERLDHALGRSREALSFRRPATPWFARLAFAEPISAPQDMARVAVDIAAKLCAHLETQGQGARRFEIAYHRLDGGAPGAAIGLSLPGRDAIRIGKLFAPKIEAIDPGFGVEVVTLIAGDVEPISGRQIRLEGANDAAIEDGLAPLVDRLANRLGTERVWRANPVESHVPERAVSRDRPLVTKAPGARPWNPETPRPVRLFRRPEPVESVMALLPDDPPTHFRWRGRLHQIDRAEGPERIGEEWWTGDIDDVRISHVRDYYRVEDKEGGRFWLFRAGLYDDPESPPKWWLHGLFP